MAHAREMSFSRPNAETVEVRLAGDWTLNEQLPPLTAFEDQLGNGSGARRVVFDATGLGVWDSSLLTVLDRLLALCAGRQVGADRAGLPKGVQRLLALAEAVPEKKDAKRDGARPGVVARIGTQALAIRDATRAFVAFVGEVSARFPALLAGHARFRTRDLLLLIQQAGADALPIITLISFLVGLILAFVGAVQLQQFGASIFIANLVGIGMVREMGAMMTGIVMAGRTGAAYAAQIGTMQVTQEVDALTTLGVSPIDFLVIPRMIALILMMPLLCLYADLMGIAGGAAMGVGILGLDLDLYVQQTTGAIGISDLAGGVFKAAVYGVLIALAGCLRGMESGKSASAVGDAATSAVVTSIVLIISACGIFAVAFYVLGI